MAKKKKTRTVYFNAAKSAVTGRWVSLAYAKRYPHRTMVVRLSRKVRVRG